ncbi:hypothetical protein J3Q64DRAFT_1694839 [Phycomyces blakesleeanus]|uniref:Uncharacterized protein n=1 Tax=Phycomyces blakesleeanus TaxID=4837 RepID=A0ABR3BB18_PHYBL
MRFIIKNDLQFYGSSVFIVKFFSIIAIFLETISLSAVKAALSTSASIALDGSTHTFTLTNNPSFKPNGTRAILEAKGKPTFFTVEIVPMIEYYGTVKVGTPLSLLSLTLIVDLIISGLTASNSHLYLPLVRWLLIWPD